MPKIFKPKTLEGREYERWVLNVSSALGVSPPATLEELAEASVVPLMSQVQELRRRIDEIERKGKHFNPVTIDELKRRVTDLERSI